MTAIILLSVLAAAALVVLVPSYLLYRLSAKRHGSPCVWDVPLPEEPSRAEIKFGSRLTDGRRWLHSAAGGSRAEHLFVTSHDGLCLSARLIQCESGVRERGVLLMLHGYRSDPIHEFGSCAETFSKMGFVLCMPSQRAHGDSEGRHLSYGINERLDVCAWARLLAERYPSMPIILFGVSMGASSVLMASSLELPESVVGVVADCGFTSPDEVCKKVMHDMHLPTFPLYYTASLLVRARAGYFFTDASALDSVSSCRIPIMLVHGTDDAFVPYEMGVRLHEAAASPCLFFSGKGAGHGESFLMHTEGYLHTFESFLKLCGVE